MLGLAMPKNATLKLKQSDNLQYLKDRFVNYLVLKAIEFRVFTILKGTVSRKSWRDEGLGR
jgi:hypothetical protein